MIKHYSIYTKLIILLSVIFLVCVLFIVLFKIEANANEEESLKQENLIKNLSLFYENNISNAKIQTYLNNNGFHSIQDQDLIKTIRNQAQILFQADKTSCVFSSLKYDNDLYFDLKCKDFNALYQTNTTNPIHNLLLVGFFAFSLLIVFMYFSVLRSLEPLKKLKKKVEEVENGKQIDLLDYEKDEIGKIAFEFQKAFKKNQELIESRQLFLRTIMHELKTPIGKGRIISEMIKEDRQKERLINIFLRMDSLINEIAKIENLFSKNYNLHFKPIRFSAILQETKEHLMRDDFNKIVKVDLKYDALINVDTEIFSIILKNLIDNALKYSHNGICELFCCKECFIVKNLGKPLAEPIEHYLEAFTREKHTQVKGMGLGLYIVSEVCKLHDFDLIYFYDEGKHCFKIFFGAKEK